MTFWIRWPRRATAHIVDSLARIEQQGIRIMSGLDDIKANQTKERALVEKLIGLVQAVPAGTFTPEQQATIDQIMADQAATLAEDPSPATT